jgi:hypothetical protein
MSELMSDLEFVHCYIDDVLCISKGSWEDHLSKLEQVLNRLSQAELKVNANKSFFGRMELECLGFWINREGIQPIPKKSKQSKISVNPKTKGNLDILLAFCGSEDDIC